jgi:hypothetical protein
MKTSIKKPIENEKNSFVKLVDTLSGTKKRIKDVM